MTQYTLAPVTYSGATQTVADGINDAGEIVGQYVDAGGAGHGFTDVGGNFTSLDDPSGSGTIAAAVNSSGEIVGYDTDAAGNDQGFADNNGTFSTINYPGATSTLLTGVNDAGEIVGSETNASGVSGGFVDNGGGFTAITYPGAIDTVANSINNSGEIVGTYEDSSFNTHGFVDNAGAFTSFDYPGAIDTFAIGLNGAGQIAGTYYDTAGLSHAFTDNGGTFSSIDVAGSQTTASGVNDAGQVVGHSTSETTGVKTAYIATPVCFAGGTAIRTARGDVAVEDLQVGDLAVTATGSHRSITWIGNRKIGAPLFEQHPVRILAGAFGGNLPERDLLLSPGHPVLVGDHLVPIMSLINGTSISRASADQVTYWHIELDQHDLLLAEGLPAESYFDMGTRPWFAGNDGALRNPDLVPAGAGGRCLPVALDGPIVDSERRRLDALFATSVVAQCAWPSSDSVVTWA